MAKIKVNHDYPFTNDYMFATVMKNPTFCKELLNRILPDKKVRDIHVLTRLEDAKPGSNSCYPEEANALYMQPFTGSSVHNQRTIGYDLFSKSVRLDVTFEDDETIYNIEMQVSNDKNLPKRARYYSSQLDLEILPKGKNYMELKASYVIFICPFDCLNTGKAFHFFETYDVKNKLRLNDSRFTIIVNTKGKEPGMSEEVQNLFDYINSSIVESSDDFISNIDNEISWFNREDGEWRRSIMKLEEKFFLAKQEGIEIGKQDGIKIEKYSIATKLKEAKVPYKTISESTGLSVEEIEKL